MQNFQKLLKPIFYGTRTHCSMRSNSSMVTISDTKLRSTQAGPKLLTGNKRQMTKFILKSLNHVKPNQLVSECFYIPIQRVKVVLKFCGDVKTLTMDRPPVNALNPEFMSEMTQEMARLSADPSIQGLILKSANPSVFCGGMDLGYMLGASDDNIRKFGRVLHKLWETIFGSRLTILANMQGPSIAGGCLMSSSCDYRIMHSEASTGFTESKLGVIAPWYLFATCSFLLGRHPAEKALILGLIFQGENARKVGFVDETIEDKASMDQRALQIMEQYLAIPEKSRVGTKMALRKPILDYAKDHRQEIEDSYVVDRASAECQTAIRNYFDDLKRRK